MGSTSRSSFWFSENAEQMQDELKQQPSMIERLYGKLLYTSREKMGPFGEDYYVTKDCICM